MLLFFFGVWFFPHYLWECARLVRWGVVIDVSSAASSDCTLMSAHRRAAANLDRTSTSARMRARLQVGAWIGLKRTIARLSRAAQATTLIGTCNAFCCVCWLKSCASLLCCTAALDLVDLDITCSYLKKCRFYNKGIGRMRDCLNDTGRKVHFDICAHTCYDTLQKKHDPACWDQWYHNATMLGNSWRYFFFFGRKGGGWGAGTTHRTIQEISLSYISIQY